MSDPFDCTGVISQVKPSGILFEFFEPSGEKSIGLIRIEDVKVLSFGGFGFERRIKNAELAVYVKALFDII